MKKTPLPYRILHRVTLRERGAAAVEFAIIAPLFFMIVFGMFSGGIAYNEQSNLTHSSREGSRYGAVLALNTFGTPAAWATSIRDTVVNRAFGDLNSTVTNRTVCVALVEGSESNTDVNGNAAHGHVVTDPVLGNYFSWTGPGSPAAKPCFDDTGADSGQRVEVRVTRPGNLNAVLFNVNFTLNSNATAKYEITGS
jgi:Flp pilus assembly protein TadG